MIKGVNSYCNFAKVCFALAFLLVITTSQAMAQGIDPALLQGLQQQNRGAVNQQSQLDKGRDEGELLESPEEIEKRKEAAEEIAESVSFLEEDYRSRVSDEDSEISQYGYDIFQSVSMGVNASVGSVPSNYVLGIGDKLIVSFVGSTDRTINVSVDREGRVILPNLSPMNVAGRKFSEFENDIKDKVEEAMLGTDVFVSLSSVRQIGVYVLGEVAMPGLHNLTSLSSVLQALAKAGGVKKTGSLRSIMVDVAGESKIFDLYELMRSHNVENIALQDGARVIVPSIGRTVAVDGRVSRPGIFELAKGSDHIKWGELLSLAGGTLRPRGNDFAVNSFEEDGTQSYSVIAGMDTDLLSGDLAVVNFKRDGVVGEVFLTGHVQVEGARPLASSPTLSSLFKNANALEVEPYLSFAVIETTDERSQARLYKNFNLGRVLSGEEDVDLKDRDRVVVFGSDDVAFLSSSALRAVVLTGEYEADKCQALGDVAEFINSYGRDRFDIISRNIFIETKAKIEVAKPESDDKSAKASSVEADEEQEDVISAEDGGVLSFSDVVESDAKEECVAIFEENAGLLSYSLEHVASVTGSVRSPGLFPISNAEALSSIMSSAGGLSRNADASLIEVLMVDGNHGLSSEKTTRVTINSQNQSLDDVLIKPNYSVRANARETDQESGTVLLSGEFARPGVYAIIKGETMSGLIERAGGLTDYAYPIGAVFTRLSAKEAQQESFRRAAREIDSALAVAAVRSDVEADAIVAAQGLSRELTTIEALGRVVVEADVSVLRVRPELDTILEPGDKLVMPKRPNYVVLGGDVLNPGSLQFISGKSVKTYLAEAGGFQRSADDDRIYLVLPNGVASPVNLSRWGKSDIAVLPGSTIIVPKNMDPITGFDRLVGITQILSQLALSAASIAVIAN